MLPYMENYYPSLRPHKEIILNKDISWSKKWYQIKIIALKIHPLYNLKSVLDSQSDFLKILTIANERYHCNVIIVTLLSLQHLADKHNG